MRFDERADVRREADASSGASKGALETFLSTCAAQNPNRRLRLIALADRVSMRVERADFDDLVTLVTQAPPWEKDRAAGVRIAPARDRRGQARRARPDPRALDVAARARRPQAARPQGVAGVPGRASGCSARSRTRAATGTRRTPRSSSTRRSRCRARSARRCSPRPRATRRARRSCSRRRASGSARSRRSPAALADDLPAPKTGPRAHAPRAAARRSRRRGRRRRRTATGRGDRGRPRATPRARDGAPKRRAPPQARRPPRAAQPREARRRRATAAPAETPPSESRVAGCVTPRAAAESDDERCLCGRGYPRSVLVLLGDRLPRGRRDGALAVRAAGAADPARGRRDRPQAVPDRRRARRELHRLHALRRLAARQARAAAGPAAEPRDRAALPRRGHAARAAARALASSGRSPALTRCRAGGGGFLLGASLGLVFVPCAGPVLAAITVVAANNDVGWRAIAAHARLRARRRAADAR